MVTIGRERGDIHQITIKQHHWDAMLTHIFSSNQGANIPEEMCGLVAGKENISEAVYPITNTLHSPTSFRMDAFEEVKALDFMERTGWDLLAIFHTHPQGPLYPSETDVNMVTFPDSVYLIWAPQGERWECRGFMIQENAIHEVALCILP